MPTPQQGVAWFLSLLALLSLSLGIMNLLPIPILDGGHLLYYLIELVKGSPVSERVMAAGQYVGLALLAGLMGLAFYNDIVTTWCADDGAPEPPAAPALPPPCPALRATTIPNRT